MEEESSNVSKTKSTDVKSKTNIEPNEKKMDKCENNSQLPENEVPKAKVKLKNVETCRICSTTFHTEMGLQAHFKISHKGELPQKCEFCPKP